MCCRATGNGDQAAGVLSPPLMDECERALYGGLTAGASVLAIGILAGAMCMLAGHRMPGTTLRMHKITTGILLGCAGMAGVIAIACGGAYMFDYGQRNALEARRAEED